MWKGVGDFYRPEGGLGLGKRVLNISMSMKCFSVNFDSVYNEIIDGILKV